MLDPEDLETGCVAVSCRRPTNTVPRVVLAESRLGQSIAGGVQKASLIRDAPQQEPPPCVSRFNLSSPKIIRNRGWYIVPSRAIATEKQFVTTTYEAPLPQARRRPSVGHQLPRLVRWPVGSRTVF